MFRLFSSGVDDLVLISSPSNGEVANNLGARFDRELIYTNIGEVLIALNPYKQLPITGPEFIKMYQNSPGTGEAPPHIYALAERAFRRLVDDGESQCVIISGESGAGKTVSAKLLLQYITAVSPNNSYGASVANANGGGNSLPQYDGSSELVEDEDNLPQYDGGSDPPMGRGFGLPPIGANGGGRGRAVPPPTNRAPPPQPGGGRGKPPPPVNNNRPPPSVPSGGGRGGPPPPVNGGGRGRAPPPPRGGGRGGGPPPKIVPSGSSRSNKQVDVEYIKKIILESNPLMEAIGNAKTVRNDNSSRFGKYLEIQFSDNNAPVGGQISTFLLEKTRVTFQQKHERNFHIFYQMLAGLDQGKKSEWGLTQATDFYYLAQSGCTTIEDVNDGNDFMEVQQAMDTVGISKSEQNDIFRILAAILHIGNIRFQGEPPAEIIDDTPVQWASSLLGVDPQFLAQSLNHRQIQSGSVRHTQYAVPQNPDQAAGLRDALAKTLYDRIFEFVVARINQTMQYFGSAKVIGVLDIYGFESFDRNSLEQFNINYVNERLQQIFIDLTVRGEQREYHEEGLKWKDISFFDNKIVVDLIDASKPPGIMRVLDDVCKTVHAVDSATADQKFMEKLIHAIPNHPHLLISNTGSGANEFTIKHYAGEVTYNVEEFCFKNNDNLYASIVACMQTSSYDFISNTLFPDQLGNNTISSCTYKIMNSANELVKKLSSCTPHYIRCIKPNDKKQPMNFVSSRVEYQVKYLGLLENIKVKRSGYAYRQMTRYFLDRFGKIFDQPPRSIPEFVDQICRKCPEIKNDEFEEGKSKVFVRSPETIFIMEDQLMQKLDPIGYKERAKLYKENEKLAQAKAGKHAMKAKCTLM
ncbi:myosin IK [Tieghemostelium lacteum]|uniref:Myosin IK n=1 Tax=Tieghemostelium lacteum TaxID=361077 RepID=A0A151ZFW8_TIELA|nr:myosin IK [Tieghemostelium lacteum]|eukprot:KYQ92809.1 myosin IK [Tieghemostelium lacteum]